MFFILPTLAVVAETTGTVLVSAGTATLGGMARTAAARVATAVGIESATATILGTIAAGSITTALNVGIVETGKSFVKD